MFNFVTFIRGDNDILLQNLDHHLNLGFARYLIISHVEHENARHAAHFVRSSGLGVDLTYIEIDNPYLFSQKKGQYINSAIRLNREELETNVIFCADADDFLHLGGFNSIQDLYRSFRKEFGHDRLFYLSLPWIDLIPEQNSSLKLGNDFFNTYFFALEDSGWNGTKVLFEYKDNNIVHMGFHWLTDLAGERIAPERDILDFIQDNGLCVYHIPIRSSKQFRQRMKNYRQSASMTSKYNVLDSLLHRPGMPTVEEVVRWCMADAAKFDGLDGVAEFFQISLSEAGALETIAKYLSAKRIPVGSVFSKRSR